LSGGAQSIRSQPFPGTETVCLGQLRRKFEIIEVKGSLSVTKFTVHTIETAPEKAKPTLQALEQKFGFLPNVMASMANNPVLLDGFAAAFSSFHGGSLDECEKQALLLTNAVTIKCPWTVAAHSTFALEDGMAPADVQAMRRGELPAHPKYAALSGLTKALIERRGAIGEAELERFTAAGYAPVQIFEVITGIGISTMAATTTNMACTPVEERFQAQAWTAA
jgi:alkylhydroperoxidase family enzyme